MKAILHHSASKATHTKPQLMAIDESHRKRFGKLSDLNFYVGYHFFIERDGTYTQTRNLNERGYHTYDERNPNIDYGKYIGICMAGNFEEQKPSPKQLETLRVILFLRLLIKKDDIFLHRQLDQTKCPGKNFTLLTVEDLYEQTKEKKAARKLLLKGKKYWDIVSKLLRGR